MTMLNISSFETCKVWLSYRTYSRRPCILHLSIKRKRKILYLKRIENQKERQQGMVLQSSDLRWQFLWHIHLRQFSPLVVFLSLFCCYAYTPYGVWLRLLLTSFPTKILNEDVNQSELHVVINDIKSVKRDVETNDLVYEFNGKEIIKLLRKI